MALFFRLRPSFIYVQSMIPTEPHSKLAALGRPLFVWVICVIQRLGDQRSDSLTDRVELLLQRLDLGVDLLQEALHPLVAADGTAGRPWWTKKISSFESHCQGILLQSGSIWAALQQDFLVNLELAHKNWLCFLFGYSWDSSISVLIQREKTEFGRDSCF